MKLCLNENCSTIWGFWSWIPTLMFDGIFWGYSDSYFGALWRFMTNRCDEEI